jgi:hypothetical protein
MSQQGLTPLPVPAAPVTPAAPLRFFNRISVLDPLASVIAETFFGNEVQHDKAQSRCAWSNPSAGAESLGEFRF